MKWHRRSFGFVRRSVLAVAAVAAMGALYAPVALASPETDAADAINAAWDAAGGDASTLGPRQGDIYPAGAGFGQNFAGGAIFYSPDTGAKIMHGAILDKYRELGGPADSDLGFPNIDEGPGRVSPDSRNSTFNAGDRPVIFWTSDTGARVVRGAINAAWDKLGGSSGRMGVPNGDETFDGDVASQTFTGGTITYDLRTRTFTTEPPEYAAELVDLPVPSDAASEIARAWRAAGGQSGPLGAKAGAQYSIGDTGVGQDFAGGKVFYSPETGAFAVTGDILAKYESIGGPAGAFGFPVSSAVDGGVPNSLVQSFAAADNPVIFYTEEHGAVIVGGAMKAAWDTLGGATGELGVPVKDQNTEGTTVTQEFAGGSVAWDSATNTFTTDPAHLAESLQDLEVSDVPVPTAPPTPPAADDDGGLAWKSWWLWWIIPLALLVLGSLWAWSASRKRQDAAFADTGDGDDDAFNDTYQDSYAGDRYRDRRDDEGYDTAFDDGRDRYEDRYSGHYGQDSDPGRYGQDSDEGRYGQDFDEDFDDQPDERTEFLSTRSSWADEATTAVSYDRGDDDLFTHHGAHETDEPGELVDLEDEDDADTAPTRVISADTDTHSGRHAAVDIADAGPTWATPPEDHDYLPPRPGSLFEPVYGSAQAPESRPGSLFDEPYGEPFGSYSEPEPLPVEETFEQTGDYPSAAAPDVPAPPAIHLPLDDPHQAPDGYPVKGSMRTGKYHAPGTPGYEDTVAEIWFASPELAEANGFSPAD